MIYVNILIEYWHQYMSISRGGRFININILLIFIRWTIFGYRCIVDTTHNIEILSFNMGCLIYRSPLVTIQLLGFVIFFMLKDFFLIATHYTWHVTCNTWHVTYGGQWTFSQNFSSLALTVWELDGVGPVDNRPSTDQLHHFVKKNLSITKICIYIFFFT